MVERVYPPNIDNVLPPIEIIDRDGKEWYKLTVPFEFTGFTTAINLSGIYIKLRESMSNNQIGPDFYIPGFLT